jgi:predicted MPP superfamily phosphohydrolase
VHIGQIHNISYLQKVISKIAEQKPDIILIGGDLFDGSIPAIKNIVPALRKAPLGVYYVTGNHEEFGSNEKFVAAVKDAGIQVLDDKLTEIDGLQLLGVSYSSADETEKFKKLLVAFPIDKNKPSILIKHEPRDIDIAEEAGISLQLSGHTHHAQIWPFRFLPKRIYKGFDYGLKNSGKTQVYTSSGVGTWGPPMRVGTDSEIVIISF